MGVRKGREVTGLERAAWDVIRGLRNPSADHRRCSSPALLASGGAFDAMSPVEHPKA